MSGALPDRRHPRKYLAVLLLPTLLAAAGAAIAAPAVEGPDVRPQIVGGSPALDGEFPFVGAIRWSVDGGVERRWCGASLLTPKVVLTAAHCAEPLLMEDHGQLVVSVTFDRADLRHLGKGQQRRVARDSDGKLNITIHPGYEENAELERDVAVMILEEPVTGIEPVLLPTPGSDVLERPGTLVTVAGWGNTSRYGGVVESPDRLRKVQVPVVSPFECRFAYGSSFVAASMLCAGVSGRDSCQGDSGGPLFLQMPGEQAVMQLGVVSFGNGCAKVGKPGVYTRLSDPQIQSWLEPYTGL